MPGVVVNNICAASDLSVRHAERAGDLSCDLLGFRNGKLMKAFAAVDVSQ